MASECGCGHGTTWHRTNHGVRLSCGYPGCGCSLYVVDAQDATLAHFALHKSGIVTKAAAMEVAGYEAPVFKPSTKAVSAAKEFVQDSATASFMIDMAGKTLAQARLNKLGTEGYMSMAKMGTGFCRTCGSLRQLMEGSQVESYVKWYNLSMAFYISGRMQLRRFMQPEHLTVKHVAEIFHVPADMLKTSAKRYLQIHLGDGDEAEEGDELGMVIGWRNWNLSWEAGTGLFALVPPSSNSDERVYVNTVEALHNGDRFIALSHLQQPKQTSAINDYELTVNQTRASCSCGLYCWTSLDLHVANGYWHNTSVTANIIPYGIVQMGSDGESLRASDMMINRLIVYKGATMINGVKPAGPQQNLHTGWGWFDFEPVDLVSLMYRELCQRLSDQFQVQVDLAEPDLGTTYIHEGSETTREYELKIIETFTPRGQMPVDAVLDTSLWSKS